MRAPTFLLSALLPALLQGAEPVSREAQVFKAMLELPVLQPLSPPIQESAPGEPEENGPLEALICHWSRIPRNEHGPSPWVQERFLQACEQDPNLIPRILWLIPPTPATARRVRSLHDALSSGLDGWDFRVNTLRDWLKDRTDTFRDELLQEIQPLFHGPTDTVDWEAWGALESLSKVDWAAARPLVLRTENHPNPLVQAYGLCLRYERAMQLESESPEDLRPKVLALAENPSRHPWVRSRAVEILCQYPWPGWEAWYLKLFKDPSLVQLQHEGERIQVLLQPAVLSPKRWIPDLLRMIDGQDRAARDNAIDVLVGLSSECLGPEELRPLVPWLLDPEWSRSPSRDGALRAIAKIHLPEAIPGMISILAAAPGSSEALIAACFLFHNPDPAAIPHLQAALEQPSHAPLHAMVRSGLRSALFACGGLSEDEAIACLEAFACWQKKGGNLLEGIQKQDLPREALIGWQLLRNPAIPNRLAPALVKRARLLEIDAPEVSEDLRKLLWNWGLSEGDAEIIRRLGTEDLRLSDVIAATQARERLQQTHREALQRFAQEKGWRGGMASVLLEDGPRMKHLLTQGCPDARLALLATARLARVKLPAGPVALLSLEGRTLARAADLYLKAASGF